MILNEEVFNYLEQLIPARTGIVHTIEQEGLADRVPIIQPAGVQALRLLTKLHRPSRILEVGTAIGYSTIHLAEAAPEADVVTLEIDEQRAKQAKRNIEAAGLSDRISVVLGDAVETIPTLDSPFDLVFIDAAKGKYELFFDLVFPMLSPGGLIIVDNVLFRGMVALEQDAMPKKYRSMLTKLNRFNAMLAKHPELDTMFLPVGDGLAVCQKRKAKVI